MNTQMTTRPPNRCRLVLVVGHDELHYLASQNDAALAAFFSAGDISSILFHNASADPSGFQSNLEKIVPIAQSCGIACLIAEDSQIAGRVQADGLHLGQDHQVVNRAIETHSPHLMIGAGNVKTRHNALVIGELQPDYVMFGAPGGDTREEPHPKNLALGEWWSSMVEIPCIVLGGNTMHSVVDVAACGAEFVALSSAIFSPEHADSFSLDQMTDNIIRANELLDQHATPLDEIDE